MRTMMTKGAAMAALVLTMTIGAGAIEQRPLPAFEITNAAGTVVPSATIGPGGKWLLIYVTPECGTCVRLFKSMEQWNSPQVNLATVVIVQGPFAGAQRYAADNLPEALVGGRWFADVGDAGRSALKLTGAPVLIGMQDQQIKWAIAGVLNDPTALESALRTWVEKDRP